MRESSDPNADLEDLLFEPDATETAGRVYGFNLVYSGNHYASAQRSHQGLTRVMQGINGSNFSRLLAREKASKRRKRCCAIPRQASAACPGICIPL